MEKIEIPNLLAISKVFILIIYKILVLKCEFYTQNIGMFGIVLGLVLWTLQFEIPLWQ
jgi:hypothetical protein